MSDCTQSEAFAAASIPVLLMCLAQITREKKWIQPPYLIKRDISIFAEPSGGLAEQAQQEIREALNQVLDELKRGTRTLPDLPTDDEMVVLMSACLGETVPPEYAPMAMEEMGFSDREVPWREPRTSSPEFSVIVIGAGFSGLCATHRLQEMGVPFTVFEKNDDLGGAWFENVYPESGVDTPNHYYSFSFAPNRDWSSNYSKRDEVWAYQNKVVQELGLRSHIEFGVEVISLVWYESKRLWQVSAKRRDGSVQEHWANAIITAVGQLNRPRLSSIAGLDCGPGHEVADGECSLLLRLVSVRAHVALRRRLAAHSETRPILAAFQSLSQLSQRYPAQAADRVP